MHTVGRNILKHVSLFEMSLPTKIRRAANSDFQIQENAFGSISNQIMIGRTELRRKRRLPTIIMATTMPFVVFVMFFMFLGFALSGAFVVIRTSSSILEFF